MATFDQLVRNANKAVQRMGGLISALLAPNSRQRSNVRWDPTRARFRAGEDQTIVNVARVRREMLKVEARQIFLTREYNYNLFSGKWDLKKWKSEMGQLIEDSHMLSGSLASGSLQNGARSEVVQRRIKRDLEALDRFAADINSGKVPSLQFANNRGRTYARSPFVTYNLLEQRNHIDAGYRFARRRLSIAEHCRSKNGLKGCLEAAAEGWQDIRKVDPIGTLVCKQFCRCWIQYKK